MVIDKDKDILRHPGSGVAVSEDRPLSIGNDGWEKSKIRKKRSGIKPDVYINAILEYKYAEYNSSIAPLLPTLPFYNSTSSALDFVHGLRSPLGYSRQVDVLLNITTHMLSTVSINTLPCSPNTTYAGPNGTRLAASMSNISFVLPHIDILEAYYYDIRGVYGDRFRNFPPLLFDFTAKYQPLILEIPNRSTQVKILEYDEESFYVVGYGLGNFDPDKDPLSYNLVDPPLQNTVMVPVDGWATVRFRAQNPGVWFMHCHLECHLTWGMENAFIVKDGESRQARMLPPPLDMPRFSYHANVVRIILLNQKAYKGRKGIVAKIVTDPGLCVGISFTLHVSFMLVHLNLIESTQ